MDKWFYQWGDFRMSEENRVHITFPSKLYERLCNYVLKKYGVTALWGKRPKVVIQAVEEFLDRHEKEVEKK